MFRSENPFTSGSSYLGKMQGGGVGFLSINGQILDDALLFLHEAFTLYEPAVAAAASVIDSTMVGFEHGDQHFGNDYRRPESPARL